MDVFINNEDHRSAYRVREL